jgi:hypothetical protein
MRRSPPCSPVSRRRRAGRFPVRVVGKAPAQPRVPVAHRPTGAPLNPPVTGERPFAAGVARIAVQPRPTGARNRPSAPMPWPSACGNPSKAVVPHVRAPRDGKRGRSRHRLVEPRQRHVAPSVGSDGQLVAPTPSARATTWAQVQTVSGPSRNPLPTTARPALASERILTMPPWQDPSGSSEGSAAADSLPCALSCRPLHAGTGAVAAPSPPVHQRDGLREGAARCGVLHTSPRRSTAS